MNIVAAILFILFFYFFIKRMYSKKWNSNLSVDIAFLQKEAFEGDTINLTETIINRKILPLPILLIKFNISRCLRFTDSSSQTGESEAYDDGVNSTVTDYIYRNDIISMSPFQKKVRTLSLKCYSRGYCHISSVYTIASDLFINKKMTDIVPCNTELYIYPKFIDAQKFNLTFNSLMGEIQTKRYINEDPFEFKGIRDYQSYDSLKSVNWKASARSMGLKVNQLDTTASCQITIMLNLDFISGLRDEDVDEQSIRLAATLSKKFIDLGLPVSFITNARDDFSGNAVKIQHGCGQNHLQCILKSLSCIGVYKNMPYDFCSFSEDHLKTCGDNNLLVVISPLIDEKIAEYLLPYQKNLYYILPIRPDSMMKIPNSINKCVLPWTIEY